MEVGPQHIDVASVDADESAKAIELDKGKCIIDDLPTMEEQQESIDENIKRKFEERCALIPKEYIPKVGMVFKTEEEAYDFYNRYAGMLGFITRKSNRNICRRTGEVNYRKFCCSKQGKREVDKRRPCVRCHRAETRCGCMAEMRISLREDGCFHVIVFNETHNHIIAIPTKAPKLRSQRMTSEAQAAQVKPTDNSRITPKASMELEVGPHSIHRLDFESNGNECQHIDVVLHGADESSKSVELDKGESIVNDFPTKEQQQQSFDASIKRKLKERCALIPEECTPKVGMMFKTEEEAYDFYNRYAGMLGFTTRKSNRNLCRMTGEVNYRKFCCSKQGKRAVDKRRPNVKQPRVETRCGCMAEMRISIREDGFFHVIVFSEIHNHIIAAPRKAHTLRSRRINSEAQVKQAKMANDLGLALKASMELIAKEAGAHENVESTSTDLKNYLHSCRTGNMEKGEAGAILQYCQDMQEKDPSFSYAVQLDQDELVTNMFWADAHMIVDYSHFGDVVCFDTTYRINNENRPFALFVGVNNHKQSIIFGAAFLYDETVETFEWLFKTFIKTMGGKRPKTILTDDDASIAKAIGLVLPGSHHRLCVWHVFQNATKHLSGVFQNFKTFSEDLSKCVFDYEEVDEFENAWESMINKYNLQENDWLQKLYEKRYRWALVFGRQTFSADISTTQRSESMNSCLKKYLNIKYDLSRFLRHFERVVADRRYEELKAEFATQNIPTLAVQVDILNYVAHIYTPPIFSMFYTEVLQQLNCSIDEDRVVSETITEYEVSVSGKRKHIVAFNSANDLVNCSCRKFEFIGILCVHALKVLNHRHIKTIPSHYILRRWTVDVKVKAVEASCGSNITLDEREKAAIRYKEMNRLLNQVADRAASVEDAYKVVMESANRLLKEVTECLKHTNFEKSFVASKVMGAEINDTVSSICSPSTHFDDICKDAVSNNISSTEGVSSTVVKGFKDKVTTVCSSKRPTDALEKTITKRTKWKNNQSVDECSTRQPTQESNEQQHTSHTFGLDSITFNIGLHSPQNYLFYGQPNSFDTDHNMSQSLQESSRKTRSISEDVVKF
ncbi:PREDICTED: protein FAR1-RELATED SEQUENCE 5-like isoform X2 [Nelumbo nucifera]|uniref:Protein FAR1-RELATED SEQUENCE 5-like isoform X2 n=1 Tax=Nelumbo nucifera TaxID=4432 RepID=A0A1U8AKM7_NELNU|nr:PREDICTED: protein FAR1-RELATED SEQUENCE 5-like isoform X2 [Nelumbo nucifera]